MILQSPVSSKALGTDRFVRVCLPPAYEVDSTARFPVLYVHDGQNALSIVGDHVAFGWGNWQLDLTVAERSAAGQMRPIILVAIDCGAQRYLDYRGPAYPHGSVELTRLKRAWLSAGPDRRYGAYGRFMVKELKPMIDAQYRTLPGPDTTGVLGSSMGGLCSLALAWQFPDVFGLAASLSGAFQVERRNFLVHILKPHVRRKKPIRIYLDSGVTDHGGGDDGLKHTRAVAQELRRIGWRDGVDLMHFLDEHPLDDAQLECARVPRDKWSEAKISQHNELYWRLRAWRALTFLFPVMHLD